jgi:anti-sigma regulatory factor (Ser/Thr protein kinase)
MYELSLSILDVVQNAIRAEARRVTVQIDVNGGEDRMTIAIEDDGKGMNEQQRLAASDPFFTTRTTRRIGLGLPYFKMVAEMSGGDFQLHSKKGEGTRVEGRFQLSHIDRPPLGNMGQTMAQLTGANPGMDFLYTLSCDGKTFRFDTVEIKAVLGGLSLGTAEIMLYLEGYINEQSEEIIGGISL